MSAFPFFHGWNLFPRLSLICVASLLLLPAPAPGTDLDGTALNRHAEIRSGDVYGNVYGNMNYNDRALARYGTVINNGGQAIQVFGGWSYGNSADAAYNSVVVRDGIISNNVYGGFAGSYEAARSNSNTVVQSGGEISHIVGGHADSGRGKALADSNLVIIEGGTAGTVVGGHGAGYTDSSARYNLVSISGGTVASVAGGSATTTQGTADASFNAVLVSGGSIKNHIIGGIVYASSTGQNYTARYNAITLTGGSIDGDVYGSARTNVLGTTYTPLPAAGSGNSLNLLGWQGTLRRVAAFQDLNLALPNGMRSGETLLTLGSGQTAGDLQGGTVRVLGALGGQGMRIGDRYTLVRSTYADELALRDGGIVRDAPKGFALRFDGTMQHTADAIDLTITGLRANPQLKAFNQYAGGGLMARFDLTSGLLSGLLSGLYAQAGLRLGQINGDWKSQDIASELQQTAEVDTSTAYYGMFASLGYQWQATERLRLDSRASFFWNHQDGQDFSIMGEAFSFDPMDSYLLRIGTRLSYEVFQGFSPYAGVAWEHEFDGTARTELSNHGVDAPSVSMRGDSAVFMAGLQWDPSNSSLHVDLGVEGSAGIRQSIGGQARLVWEF